MTRQSSKLFRFVYKQVALLMFQRYLVMVVEECADCATALEKTATVAKAMI